MFVAGSRDIVEIKAVLLWQWSSADTAAHRCGSGNRQNSCQRRHPWCRLHDHSWT